MSKFDDKIDLNPNVSDANPNTNLAAVYEKIADEINGGIKIKIPNKETKEGSFLEELREESKKQLTVEKYLDEVKNNSISNKEDREIFIALLEADSLILNEDSLLSEKEIEYRDCKKEFGGISAEEFDWYDRIPQERIEDTKKEYGNLVSKLYSLLKEQKELENVVLRYTSEMGKPVETWGANEKAEWNTKVDEVHRNKKEIEEANKRIGELSPEIYTIEKVENFRENIGILDERQREIFDEITIGEGKSIVEDSIKDVLDRGDFTGKFNEISVRRRSEAGVWVGNNFSTRPVQEDEVNLGMRISKNQNWDGTNEYIKMEISLIDENEKFELCTFGFDSKGNLQNASENMYVIDALEQWFNRSDGKLKDLGTAVFYTGLKDSNSDWLRDWCEKVKEVYY